MESMASNDAHHTSEMARMEGKEGTMQQSGGHAMMAMDDPSNPQNWSASSKVHASAVASAFTFVLLFAATSYSAGLPLVVKEFGVTPVTAVLPQAVFIFGIIAAPLVTPHIVERIGRNFVNFTSLILMALFILGASRSETFGALVACRFFAGLFGGPMAVNIEGSYADLWPATFTGSYYTFITSSQYFGAATGAIVGGALVNRFMDWRWTQYMTVILALGALLLAAGVNESYPREILRRRARCNGVAHKLPAALSGVTFAQMSHLTLTQPLLQLVTDPITALSALYLSLNFGITFQWFITVPPTLTQLAHFTPLQVGLAFLSAIAGTILAGLCTFSLDQFLARRSRATLLLNPSTTLAPIEHRLISAALGSVLLATGILWVANTASPAFHPAVPIAGTGVFVWGSAMTLTGFISYLFDVYDSRAVLSTLSIVAYARIATAGWLPLAIIPLTDNLTPKWGLSLLGICAAVFVLIPVALLVFGARLRKASRFRAADDQAMSPVLVEARMHSELGDKVKARCA